MQKFILLFWLMVGALFSQAQTTIKFDYDANGNRTGRYVASVSHLTSKFRENITDPVAEVTDGAQTIAIYPNPTKGIFAIGVKNLNSQAENYYMLYNMQGRLLQQGRITSDRTSVDITWDAAGMYLLNVYLGGNVSKWKIVKQ